MRFSTFDFKNLLRRPARTTLTVIGIALAVVAVVERPLSGRARRAALADGVAAT